MTEALKVPVKPSSRATLLKAATELMIETGSIEVSLNEIAQRAKLNSALVKYYFGNKSGLMLALCEDILGDGIRQLEGLLGMDLPVVDKLKVHIKGVINIYFRYPFVNRLIHAMMADDKLAVKVSTMISKPLSEFQRRLLEDGVRSGHFRPLDPTMFYFIVMGACDQLFFGIPTLNHAFGVEGVTEELKRKYSDALIDLVLGGILAGKAG